MTKKKVSKPAMEDLLTTKKRLQPVEEPLTANKRLQLAAEDPPTAAKHPQPLKTVLAESSDGDEEMETEEESDSSSDENQKKESIKPNDERDWFLKSFLVGSIASGRMDEDVVKQRWNMVPMKTKKKLAEKWKLLQAKEFECVLQKTNLLHEVTSVISEAN